MSYGNAVRQREEMLTAYKQMLETETDLIRRSDIEKQILLIQDQISQLKVGKPLFGKVKPLNITTTLIEPNPEKPGEQIVTVVNPQPAPRSEAETPNVILSKSKDEVGQPKRLGNKLRDTLKNKQAISTEDSLKAQIAAAKASKKESRPNV